MTIERVAIVYDDRPRPETTGSHCLAALEDRSAFPELEVEHVRPDQLPEVPHERFDLYLYVDDGLTRSFSARHRPVAWWAIDTHLAGPEYVDMAREADVVFAAQRNGAEWFRSEGIEAEWLPLACNPAVHRRMPTEKRYDFAFVGNVLRGARSDLLETLKREFPNHFVGRRFGDAMAETFSAARVVFNRSIRDDVNMRVFEALACGSLLVTNDLTENGQSDLFEDGTHLVTYRDEAELVERIRHHLANETEREWIAAAGEVEVLARHTYRHRMDRLLELANDWLANCATKTGSGLPPQVSDYHSFERPEVVALVPTSARRVLDVGCGAGRLGAAIKARQPAHITGIEFDETAATAARARLDEVVHGDAETAVFPPRSFDCVVCADVLEHLRDPHSLLRRIREWLTPDGRLVTSLPNVRHNTVVRGLLEGNWTYESAGLLDETHLRFFTRREIEKLLFRTGFSITERRIVPGPGHAEWVAAGRPTEVRVGGLSYRGREEADAEEFFAYQYLTSAEPSERHLDGLTSIVIVTHGQLQHTMACLDSIRRFTDEPYEFIVVDNASPDGTLNWLRRQADIRLVENAENRGFPAAVNQGIALARGDRVLLLNNDTVVTTGWLRRMLDALATDERIGLVGPVTNNISGAQCVEAGYEDLGSLDGFAWDWSREHVGEVVDLERLVGFCLLIERRVIDAVGVLDERFGIGNFEDDDLCRRARESGFRTVVAVDSFVHHVGSATFRASDVDFVGLLAENERLYNDKWGVPRPSTSSLPKSAAESTPRFRIESSESGGLVLQPLEGRATSSDQPVLSLCMIVRDNERTIGPALESIRPWVDEMVVVDTGSTDQTPEICRELGATVHHFTWCDDFSAARNESFRHATGEWLFWMDSDDTIDEKNGRALRDLAHGPHDEDVLGYTVRVHCPGDDETDVTAVDHVKLVRNRPALRFEHRIHEQLLPAIRRAGGEVRFTELFVVHSGSDRTPEGRAGKLERDLRILHADLAERPEHPFVLFNLGMTYADVDRTDEAAEHLRRTIAVSGTDESHVPKAFALLVSTLTRAERIDEAEAACNEGLGRHPDDAELRFRSAVLHQQRGRLDEARRVYEELLKGSGERRFASVDLGLTSFKARHNLALVLEELGLTGEAETEWRAITTEHPDYRPGWRCLGESLLEARSLDEAEALADRMTVRPELAVEAAVLRARVCERRGEPEVAVTLLRSRTESNGDVDAHRELCRLLFEHGAPEDTERALRRLLSVVPDDAAAHHNLGALLARMGRYEEAANAFETSLELRPDADHTRREYERCRASVIAGAK